MKLFIVAITFFFTLAFLHLLGMKGFYYNISFYDDILHFLFGLFGSLIILPLLIRFKKTKKIFYFVFSFLLTIILGVIWEVFEFFYFPFIQFGLSDTLSDLFWASIGSFLIIIIIYLSWNKWKS